MHFDSVLPAYTFSNVETKNLYILRIDCRNKSISCDLRYRGTNKEVPSSSSVIKYTIDRAYEASSESEKYVKEICSTNISNAESLAVVRKVVKAITDKTEYEISFDANSEEGKALLGTPNLKCCVWFAIDYPELVLFKKPKKIILSRNYSSLSDEYLINSKVIFLKGSKV